jgi:hypothetical protein
MPRNGVMVWIASPRSVTRWVAHGLTGTDVLIGKQESVEGSVIVTRFRKSSCQPEIVDCAIFFNASPPGAKTELR